MQPYYQDDFVTLYNGDAIELLPQLENVASIITDPPYGVREDEDWDNLDERSFALHIMEWLPKAKRICKELVVFCSCYSPMRDLCEMLWPRVRVCIWDKPSGSQYAGSSERGMWFSHETILHCYEPKQIAQPKCLEPARLIKQARESVGLSRGGVDMIVRGKKTGLCFRWEEAACLPTPAQIEMLKTVLPLNEDFDAAMAIAVQTKQNTMDIMQSMAADCRDVMSYRTVTGGLHSCQKPLGLMQEIIQRLTNPGDTIVDPFSGSGTTLLAAKNLGRKAVGIEIEKRHCRTAVDRLAQTVLDLSSNAPARPVPPLRSAVQNAEEAAKTAANSESAPFRDNCGNIVTLQDVIGADRANYPGM